LPDHDGEVSVHVLFQKEKSCGNSRIRILLIIIIKSIATEKCPTGRLFIGLADS
jgi:hypothetical protein